MAIIKKVMVKKPLAKKPLAKKPLVKAQKGISKDKGYEGPSVFRRYQDQLENEQLKKTADSTDYYQKDIDMYKSVRSDLQIPKDTDNKFTRKLKEDLDKATADRDRQKLKGQFGYDRNGYKMNPRKKLGGATKPLAKKQEGGTSNPKKPIVVERKSIPPLPPDRRKPKPVRPLPPDTIKPVINKPVARPYLKGGVVKKKK